METQRQMRLRWRFPVAGLPLVNSSLSPCCHDLSHAQKKKREGTCLIKCPSTRILIVLKTESFFSPFKAFRHQKCRFSKNGPQSGVFPCKRWLSRDLTRTATAGKFKSEFVIFQSSSRLFHLAWKLCRMYVTSLGAEFLRVLSRLKKRKKISSLLVLDA